MRLATVVLLAAIAATAAASFSFPEVTSVRVKRQQCRCLRLVNGGGMQCSCMQPLATNELGTGLASQVSQAAGSPQASCQCIQIFISDSPTYRCLCDPRGGIQTPPTTVGVTIQTTVPVVTQPATQTTQPTQPTTLPTLPPITTPPPTLPPTITTQPPTLPPITTPPTFSYPTNPPITTVPTLPTVPSTISTFPPITTPPTTVTPPFTFSTAPTTFTTPPLFTSPPLITPSSTFPPITTPPTVPTVTLPPVTYPVTIPTMTTTPLPTPGPSSTTPGYEPPVTATVPPSQACQCIMIRINGPQNAQYQCSCPGVANPIPVAPGGTGTGVTGAPAIPSQNDAPSLPYPATGVTNGTSAGCFCLDGANPNLGCGCSCDCFTLTVTIPTGVCVCPQDDSGRVVTTPGQPGQTPSYTNPVTPSPTQPAIPGGQQTLPPITPGGQTYPGSYTPSASTLPVVYPQTGTGQTGLPTQPVLPVQPTQPNLAPITTTMAPIVQPGQPGATPSADGSATTTLPLTTTCILYPVAVNGGTTMQQQCTCMPQYEQCAQNVCCLSSRFRSQKNEIIRAAADATGVQESTLDIFVDMFNKIKNRFSATA